MIAGWSPSGGVARRRCRPGPGAVGRGGRGGDGGHRSACRRRALQSGRGGAGGEHGVGERACARRAARRPSGSSRPRSWARSRRRRRRTSSSSVSCRVPRRSASLRSRIRRARRRPRLSTPGAATTSTGTSVSSSATQGLAADEDQVWRRARVALVELLVEAVVLGVGLADPVLGAA